MSDTPMYPALSPPDQSLDTRYFAHGDVPVMNRAAQRFEGVPRSEFGGSVEVATVLDSIVVANGEIVMAGDEIVYVP